MICERALGRVEDDEPAVDWIDIHWTQTLRRAQRLLSRGGRRVNVILKPGDRLRHGDVLAHAEDSPEVRIAVSVCEVDALVLRPRDMEQGLRLALELGNQHFPIEVVAETLLSLDDGPVREIADRLGVECRRCRHRLQPLPVILPLSRVNSAFGSVVLDK